MESILEAEAEAAARKPKQTHKSLIPYKDAANHRWEIGVDEAGRGPLFGRLYVAAAVVPNPDSTVPCTEKAFHYDWMKDSKKFTSEKKIGAVADHIREAAPFWTVKYAEPALIDEINIRQAVLRLMRECCVDLIRQIQQKHPECDPKKDVFLLIDGNDFPIFTLFDERRNEPVVVQAETVEQGDNQYCSIAAASILAKVARDQYIYALCDQEEDLDTKYGLRKNKGYGTKKHLEGLRTHGPTDNHRKSFHVKHL